MESRAVNILGIFMAVVFLCYLSYKYTQISLLSSKKIKLWTDWFLFFGMVFCFVLASIGFYAFFVGGRKYIDYQLALKFIFVWAAFIFVMAANLLYQILQKHLSLISEFKTLNIEKEEIEKRAADAVQRFVDSNVELHKKVVARDNSRRAMLNIMSDLDSSKKQLERSEKLTRILNEQLVAREGQLISITEELQHANTELARVNALKTEFVSMVAHELKIPMAVIKEATSFLLMPDFNPEKKHRYLEIIVRHVEKLNRLVADLLDLSRIESGRLVLKKETLDLKKVIENAIVGLALGAEAKGLRIESKIDDNLPPVLGDEDRLTEVMNNLLGNSIKYTEHGVIIIEAKKEEAKVKISVADTGIGIPKQHLDKIFEKFYRGDETLARVADGTGLGLAIAKGIISYLGGRIWAESEGEGQGTRFIFTLPAV